jgi:bifunctional enzyme CysN/CysC
VQYTRNMATGASTAELAVLLVDARQGILIQTRRHAYIAALLGIRHVALAVNKIDLVGFDQARFEEIRDAFLEFAGPLNFHEVMAIPMSARHGDNVTARSSRTSWYAGPSLLEHLETVDVRDTDRQGALRLPVQWVNRPNLDFRGYAGTIAAGTVAKGDSITVARSGQAGPSPASSPSRAIATPPRPATP